MNLLFPVNMFYPVQTGGPVFTLYWHCTALAEKGIGIYIISTDTNFNCIKGNKPALNKFHQTKMGNIIYLSGRFKLLKQLRSVYVLLGNLEVIHLNSVFSPISFLSFFMVKLLKKKIRIIWSIRGEFSKSALSFNTYKKKPIIWLLKYLSKNVTFHATSHQENTDIINVLGGRKNIILPNLIHLHSKIEIKKKNQFLFIGRIHPIKCIENLILALSLSSYFKNSNYILLVVGEYEKRHEWYFDSLLELIEKKGLKNKVELKGPIFGDCKYELFAKSKFTFLPSMSENFGNVVIESLSQATPVVASFGTPWEDLKKYKAGFYVNNSPNSLAKTIDTILNISDSEYAELSSNAKSLVENKFNVKNRINDWISIYSQKN